MRRVVAVVIAIAAAVTVLESPGFYRHEGADTHTERERERESKRKGN